MKIKMIYCSYCNNLQTLEGMGQKKHFVDQYLIKYISYTQGNIFLFLIRLIEIGYYIDNFPSVLVATEIQVGLRTVFEEVTFRFILCEPDIYFVCVCVCVKLIIRVV